MVTGWSWWAEELSLSDLNDFAEFLLIDSSGGCGCTAPALGSCGCS